MFLAVLSRHQGSPHQCKQLHVCVGEAETQKMLDARAVSESSQVMNVWIFKARLAADPWMLFSGFRPEH